MYVAQFCWYDFTNSQQTERVHGNIAHYSANQQHKTQLIIVITLISFICQLVCSLHMIQVEGFPRNSEQSAWYSRSIWSMVKGFSIPVYFLLIIGVHAAPLYSGHREPPSGGYTYDIMPVRICPCSVWLADKGISHAYIIWSCTLNQLYIITMCICKSPLSWCGYY